MRSINRRKIRRKRKPISRPLVEKTRKAKGYRNQITRIRACILEYSCTIFSIYTIILLVIQKAVRWIITLCPRRKSTLDALPFDILLEISRHISIRDLCCLQCVSKNLRLCLSEHAVWHEALLDILEIVPLPRLALTLPDMAPSALRKYTQYESLKRNKASIRGKYFITTKFTGATTTITLHRVDQPHSSVTRITERNTCESVFFQTSADEIVVAAKSHPRSDLNIIKVIHYDFARGMVVPRRHFSILGRPARCLNINGSTVAVPLFFDFTYHVHLRSHHGREEGLNLRLINIPLLSEALRVAWVSDHLALSRTNAAFGHFQFLRFNHLEPENRPGQSEEEKKEHLSKDLH